MRLSKKTEYSLRALLYIARKSLVHGTSLNSNQEPVQVQEIARVLGMPEKFLEQIFLSLKRAGILESKRGVGGGYRLARDPSKIDVCHVVNLMDGEVDFVICPMGNDGRCACGITGGCGLKSYFDELQEEWKYRMTSETLETLLGRETNRHNLHFEI